MNTSLRHLPFLRNLPHGAISALVAIFAAVPATFAAPVLAATTFKHYVEKFNAEDDELYANAFPNAKAWDFLAANIPLFQCPDEDLEQTYYYLVKGNQPLVTGLLDDLVKNYES